MKQKNPIFPYPNWIRRVLSRLPLNLSSHCQFASCSQKLPLLKKTFFFLRFFLYQFFSKILSLASTGLKQRSCIETFCFLVATFFFKLLYLSSSCSFWNRLWRCAIFYHPNSPCQRSLRSFVISLLASKNKKHKLKKL